MRATDAIGRCQVRGPIGFCERRTAWVGQQCAELAVIEHARHHATDSNKLDEVVLGEDAARDVAAHRRAVGLLQDALATVIVDKVELAPGARGPDQLAIAAIGECPLALARYPTRRVPRV